ncbi:hypothetical protein N9M68_00720 [Candidatus Poseidonia alphae]|nr:hypothetical protein [Candidatus Poseidonia alphae]
MVQLVQAVLANSRMSKIFSNAFATPNTWSANTMVDTLSQQQVGILTPNVMFDRVQFQYTGGVCAWRLQNAATLQYTRWGVGVLDGLSCYRSQSIAPYSVNPNDILVAYPKEAAASGSSSVIAWVTTTKGTELVEATAAEGVATTMKSVVNEQPLGDFAFNSTLQSIKVQAQDGASVDSVEIISNDGGVVMTLFGSVRGTSLGATDLEYNLSATGLALNIGKGFILRVTCSGGTP